MTTIVRTTFCGTPEVTFKDIRINQYFKQEDDLYCKIPVVWDDDEQESTYNAFCVKSGCLVDFDKNEIVIEVKEININAQL